MNGTAIGGTRIVADLTLTCIMTVTSKIGQSNALEDAAQVYPAFMEL